MYLQYTYSMCNFFIILLFYNILNIDNINIINIHNIILKTNYLKSILHM
jgi:hypothetical protein